MKSYSIEDKSKCLVIIAIFATCLYINSLGNGFVWHDKFSIIDKQAIVESFKEIPRAFTSGITSLKNPASNALKKDIYYRPVVTLSFSLDYFLWNLRPFFFHLTNLIWYAINCLLVFIVFDVVLKSRAAALLTSILFAAHPVHTASVDFIANRLDILCLSFMLAAWYFFARDLNSARSSRKLSWAFLWVNVCFILALFSKETAIVLPLLLILYLACFSKDKISVARVKLAYYAVSFLTGIWVYLALRTAAVGALGGKAHPLLQERGALFATMSSVFADYIALLFVPLNLTTSDAAFIYNSFWDKRVVISLLLIIFLLAAAIISYKRRRWITFSVFWFFITLLPVSNIMPILYLRADHFLYIPSLGFSLFTALAILEFWKFSQARLFKATVISAAALIIFAYSILTISRNFDWKNEFTIFQKTLKINPYCREAHAALGSAYQENGSPKDAITEYQKALAINPRHYSAVRPDRVLANLAVIYNQQRDYGLAESYFKQSLAYTPMDQGVHFGLGTFYFEQKRYQEAVIEFKNALALNPHFTDARYNLGMAYEKLAFYQDAIAEYKKLLKLAPNDVGARYNLGLIYEKIGDRAAAGAEFEKALVLEPGHPEIISHISSLRANESERSNLKK